MALTAQQAKIPHYRRTKAGEWVVCGPTSLVKAGAVVTVHKKDGTTKEEEIARVGKPFDLDGVECCYGYLERGRGYWREPRSGGSGKKRVREGTAHCWETGGRCYSLDGSRECYECGGDIYGGR
jgi:hypothetical protein